MQTILACLVAYAVGWFALRGDNMPFIVTVCLVALVVHVAGWATFWAVVGWVALVWCVTAVAVLLAIGAAWVFVWRRADASRRISAR